MKRIKAGGGVIFREQEDHILVLLIYRRGVWDLPKGKLDEGESIRECAMREVEEEVGCSGTEIVADLGTTYHEYRRGGEKIGKTTHWYAMTTPTHHNFEAETEEGIEEVKWQPLPIARERVGYDNLITVLDSLQAILEK